MSVTYLNRSRIASGIASISVFAVCSILNADITHLANNLESSDLDLTSNRNTGFMKYRNGCIGKISQFSVLFDVDIFYFRNHVSSV